RESCRKSGDRYHFALCHMDLSEIYLELNMSAEAAETAHDGSLLFEQLSMRYEAAKCLANLAIALGQQGKAFQAVENFEKSRVMMVQEGNHVWSSLIDLYQAIVLTEERRYFEARRLCQS